MKEAPVGGPRAFWENTIGAFNEWFSIQQFLWSPRNISAQVSFLKYASLTDRYMPSRRGLWEQWTCAFMREYCQSDEAGRGEILKGFVGNGLSPRHHAVIVEMLWEQSGAMENQQFVIDTALIFGASYQDEGEREQYARHLYASSVLPRDAKAALHNGLFPDA